MKTNKVDTVRGEDSVRAEKNESEVLVEAAEKESQKETNRGDTFLAIEKKEQNDPSSREEKISRHSIHK